MDFDKLFPGRFIKAGDFGGKDVTLKVSEVKIEELEGDKGKQTKGIISFEGAKKSLVLNRTNGECFKAMFGRDTDAWIGKRVTLYPAPLDGDICIRVRGSPDIERDINFELKLPRKKAKMTTLKAMRQKGAAAPATKPAEEPPPLDEPPPDVALPTMADQPNT